MATPFRVGLIGCGRISDIYLENLARFPGIEVVACSSLDAAESRDKAAKHGIAVSCTPDQLLARDDIEAVLNLTVPAAHADISLAAIDAGKHVYSEKPLAASLADATQVMAHAAERGLTVANAPDTFLGGRWQTARKLIDSGAIGAPTGVAAFVGTHGVERHHPNPDFYYQQGGGPLLDLGPYYLSAMVFLLGPIAQVAGMTKRTFDRRQIENGPRDGEWMPVEVDTHVNTLMAFESGVLGSMMISFDVWDSETPRLEIYGEDGSLCVPDPDPVHGANVFEGEVWYRTRDTARWTHQPRPSGRASWQIAPNSHGFNYNARGLGLLEMADAIRTKRSPRANAALAYHTLEAMLGVFKSQRLGEFVSVNSRCERPALLPEDFATHNAFTV
ncbi:MAG: Gfo/Idh/MocA family oxidoreductase [Pseudomonadota bacterium]